MLVLKNIVKDYIAGDSTVRALDRVSIAFRKNEFVSVLGHSGCGKTTLLNIIGGLDRYTSGVMSIKGVSTEKYKDTDWDTYRNHSIGFVFQTYNLIPHQTVLSNVELALTLSGVSSAERKRRAIEVLKKVGLGDQLHKKPNQMSGGQMQRVAIARALINDPEILLADEPTGALDTETSVQIMELLKEISHDKLIIMVTHNPELAAKYSDRIIKLKDGQVMGDSNPYSHEEAEADIPNTKSKASENGKNSKKRPSMSFWTALSLSFNNLLTKKTRTFLTSFAGSIGIIGIALILSLSSGINAYINKVQRETLSSYPIKLMKEEMDMSSMITSLVGANSDKKDRPLDKVYVSTVTYDLMQSMINPDMNTNNLKKFKEYLESEGCEIKNYQPLIRYGYNVDVNAFVMDKSTDYVKADIGDLYQNMMNGVGMNAATSSSMSSMMSSSSYSVWEEILPPSEGSDELIHDSIKSEYDLIYGNWPKDKSDVMLVINENNEISDMALYSLGLVSYDDMLSAMLAAMRGEEVDTTETTSYSYDDILKITYKLIPTSAYYINIDGEWVDSSKLDNKSTFNGIVAGGLDLNICGIIRQSPNASATSISGTLVYTSALTDYIIEETAKSEIVKQQISNPNIDVFTGLPFNSNTDNAFADNKKPAAFKEYVSSLSITKQAELYRTILTTPSAEYVKTMTDIYMEASGITDRSSKEDMINMLLKQADDTDPELIKMYFESFEASKLYEYIYSMMEEMVKTSFAESAQKSISDIENTPSAVELDAEMAAAVLSPTLVPSNVARVTLKTLLTSAGQDASSVDSMNDITLYSSLGTMINLYASGDTSMNLYQTFSVSISTSAKTEYIVKLYTERTNLSEDVIRAEIQNYTPEVISSLFNSEIEKTAKETYLTDSAPTQSTAMRDQKVSNAFLSAINAYSDEELIKLYDGYVPTVSSSTLKDNYKLLSVADRSDPDSIAIYAKNFEDKEAIAALITNYNNAQENESDRITYTDYIGLMLSSITKIVNAISYVLIFFVSISLVVSSIMIGIITYISVLERTKEIGILRAMGASKRDISRVFNAETLIVGFASGMIGIIVTILLNIPISIIIHRLSDISGLSTLPVAGAVILVLISMFLTFIAGLIPSGIAAKKDPVESLRSE